MRRVWLWRVLGFMGALPAGGSAVAQQAAGFNENVVFLDVAHGGTDAGAHLGGSVDEKDVTLALAGRVKAALAAKGFSVLTSRDGDVAVTAEQRAGIANHSRPLACILLHASASGAGVVLAVSTLTPDAEQRLAVPWATAQAGYVSESLALREMVGVALTAGKVRQVAMRASTPPIDSLTCAAVTVELGPQGENGAVDAAYQQKVADAVTQAVTAWKAQVAPPKVVPPIAPAKGSGTPAAVSANGRGAVR